MKLLREIRPNSAVLVFDQLRDLLRGNEAIVFSSMNLATSTQRQPFSPPADPGENENKLIEIRAKLQTAQLHSNRRTMSLRFMKEVARGVQAQAANLPGNLVNQVIEAIRFEISGRNAWIGLTADLNWQISWTIRHRGLDEVELLSVEIYDAELNEIVPDYVIEYISTAIQAYEENMNATAAALLSIGLEATLRDVLISRGYAYEAGALSVDTFRYTDADVTVVGQNYALTFRDPNLKPTADFVTSTGGQGTAEIRVRRYINPKNDGRVDLYLRVPPSLVDHWSVCDVERPANVKSIGGLGQALRIARNVEKFLLPSKLPVELDGVLMTVRNNLIHLSGETLNTHLDLEGEDNQPMTVRQFLGDPWTMSSFVTTVIRFVNDSYVELKSGGS